jgi:hypothetical protein
MHTTIVKTKNGKEYNGHLLMFRPSFNWFSIIDGNKTRKFSFDEVESVITKGERITINSPPEGEDCDEIIRAKKHLDCGRKFEWTEDGKPYPVKKFEWEKKYKNISCND